VLAAVAWLAVPAVRSVHRPGLVSLTVRDGTRFARDPGRV
jgi:hypothetical protein